MKLSGVQSDGWRPVDAGVRRAVAAGSSKIVCRATGRGCGERVERLEDLAAAIERSLTLISREQRPTLRYLPPPTPKRPCWRLLLQLRLCPANPDAGRRGQAKLRPGIAIGSNACRLK